MRLPLNLAAHVSWTLSSQRVATLALLSSAGAEPPRCPADSAPPVEQVEEVAPFLAELGR